MVLAHLWRPADNRPASDCPHTADPGVARPLGRRWAGRAAPPCLSGRSVTALLVLSGLLALALPAAAQYPPESVSNAQQRPLILRGILANKDLSQRFTTGSNPKGYGVDSVAIVTDTSHAPSLPIEEILGVPKDTPVYLIGDIQCEGGESYLFPVTIGCSSINEECVPTIHEGCPFAGPRFSLSICRVLLSGAPDTSACTQLDPPSRFDSVREEALIFTVNKDELGENARKVFLAPNTTYTLLVSPDDRSDPVLYGATLSDAEDENSSPGWSIWDTLDSRVSTGWEPIPAADGRLLRVHIHSGVGVPVAVITSVDVSTPPDSHSYRPGDAIEFTVTFNEAVGVEGVPGFRFTLGDVVRTASYADASSTPTRLVFRYTVQDNEEDTDGIEVGRGPQTFMTNAADSITTTRTLSAALLDHNALGTLSDQVVDGEPRTPGLITQGIPGSDDATLLELRLENAADNAPIGLIPRFASNITDYTAPVANAVTKISVAATTYHAAASFAFLDASDMPLPDADRDRAGQQVALRVGATTIKVRVTAEDSITTQTYTLTVSRAGAPPPPPPPPPPGGGQQQSADDHANTPAEATPIALRAGQTTRTAGRLDTATDVDYFRVGVAHGGVLVVETTGSTATRGTVWQAGEELATAADGGAGQNFRLTTRVAPGSVVIAVRGRAQEGAYSLRDKADCRRSGEPGAGIASERHRAALGLGVCRGGGGD